MSSAPGLEDSTCLGAAKPICHKYWACMLPPLKRACLEPVVHTREAAPRDAQVLQGRRPCTPQPEKASRSSEDPVQPNMNPLILV